MSEMRLQSATKSTTTTKKKRREREREREKERNEEEETTVDDKRNNCQSMPRKLPVPVN